MRKKKFKTSEIIILIIVFIVLVFAYKKYYKMNVISDIKKLPTEEYQKKYMGK